MGTRNLMGKSLEAAIPLHSEPLVKRGTTPTPKRTPAVSDRQLLNESEILSTADSECLTSYLQLYNQCYRFGYLISMFFLVTITLVAAPFWGLLIGFIDFIFAMIRSLL